MTSLFLKAAGIPAAAALMIAAALPAGAQDASRALDLEDFDSILIDTFYDVRVSVGPGHSVTLRGAEDEFENARISVRGGTLVIDRDRDDDHNWWSDDDTYVWLEVTMPRLAAYTVDGSGDGEIEGINGGDLRLVIDGSGDVRIAGECDGVDILIDGSGDVRADGLACQSGEISIDGSGDVTATILQALTVDSDGSGDVDILGSPETVEITQDASGDIDIEELRGGALNISLGGSGDVDMAGTCTEADIEVHGSGSVRARGLACASATLDLSGSGEIRLTVNGPVDVSRSGSGDVELWGDPQLRITRDSGSGETRIHN